jgi:DNA-binding response OmpR family regulator
LRILVIDDDPTFEQILCQHLERAGYETFRALSGREGLRSAYALSPDLILLDVRMSDMDGYQVCKALREYCQTPIIFLTGSGEAGDVVQALRLGADDYLVKPFGMAELQARIQAIMRRFAGQQFTSRRYDDGTLLVDSVRQCVEKRGVRIEFSNIEYKLLMYLFERRGRIVPREELAHFLWDDTVEKASDYLSLYMNRLRQKIEDDPRQPVYLRTRYGVGYWFHGDGDPEPPNLTS